MQKDERLFLQNDEERIPKLDEFGPSEEQSPEGGRDVVVVAGKEREEENK